MPSLTTSFPREVKVEQDVEREKMASCADSREIQAGFRVTRLCFEVQPIG